MIREPIAVIEFESEEEIRCMECGGLWPTCPCDSYGIYEGRPIIIDPPDRKEDSQMLRSRLTWFLTGVLGTVGGFWLVSLVMP